MAITISFPYTNPSNYIFDSNKIEVIDGVVKLKNLVISTDIMAYANFNTDENFTYANGDVTGNLINGATVSEGVLNLTGGTDKYFTFDPVNNHNINEGCIRFDYIPNYTGSPSVNNYIFQTGSLGTANEFYLLHSTNNSLYLRIRDSAGNIIVNVLLVVSWNAVQGQTYIFEINYNLSTFGVRLFVNGIQQGATVPSTGIRGSNVTHGWIGSNYYPQFANFSIGRIAFFSTVQHTINHTPTWDDVPDSIYTKTNPSIKISTSLSAENLESFIETVSKTGSNDIKYIMYDNGVRKYHTTEWVNSDGTLAQSNTADEININATELLNSKSTLAFEALIHSDDGETTPSLDNIVIEYDYHGGLSSDIKTCIIWNYITDLSGVPIENVLITLTITKTIVEYNNEINVFNKTVTTLSRADGYWEIPLVENATSGMDIKYNFVISEGDNSETIQIDTIPEQDYINFNELK